nr:hypothetical transcript [Hymenolepis microstoma]
MADCTVTCPSQTENCQQCSDSSEPIKPVSKCTKFKQKNALQAIRESISPPKNNLPMPDPCEEARKSAMNCAPQNATCCCQPLN